MSFPSRDQIIKTAEGLKSKIVSTPVIDGSPLFGDLTNIPSRLSLKLELFQKTGSFKVRGALNLMGTLDAKQLKTGVTAFSGGNHAIAVAYAAKILNTSAKVVMPSSANPGRISKCRELGAEVFLVNTREEAPKLAASFQENEGRALIPPFEHEKTVAGTATLGYEFVSQVSGMDVVFVPIGGGGLAAGVSCAIKQFAPKCKVIGVQPKSADAMARSFKTGKAEFNENVDTVADSLCPPQVGSYTLSICRQFIDDIWVIDEEHTKKAMQILFKNFKLAVEGAGAISIAALMSGQAKTLSGQHVGVLVSGSNIDLETFLAHSARA